MRFSIYWIIIYLHPDNLPKFHLTSSKGVPKCDCVPVIECCDVECWSVVLCACRKVVQLMKGFGYMIKCVACSRRRLVGGLQCLVEVHNLPASVLDLARPVANLLPPPQENGRVGRLATIMIWRNVRSVDRQKSCRSALLAFIEALENSNWILFAWRTLDRVHNMNDLVGCRFRALMLLLLRAYEVTMAAMTTSWKSGPRQGRRRVLNGWLTSCKKKQNKV